MIYWKRKKLQHLLEEHYNQSCNLLLFYHGCITCQICFVLSDQRNINRENFQKFTVLCLFKEVAEASEKFDHEYNKIKQMVDWLDFKEKRAQKACKGEFFKKQLLSQMQLVNTNQLAPEKYQQNNESVCETSKDVDTLGKCVRQQYKYESS